MADVSPAVQPLHELLHNTARLEALLRRVEAVVARGGTKSRAMCTCLDAECRSPGICMVPRAALSLAIHMLKVVPETEAALRARAIVCLAAALPDDSAARLNAEEWTACRLRPQDRRALCRCALRIDADCREAFDKLSWLLNAFGETLTLEGQHAGRTWSVAALRAQANALAVERMQRCMGIVAARKVQSDKLVTAGGTAWQGHVASAFSEIDGLRGGDATRASEWLPYALQLRAFQGTTEAWCRAVTAGIVHPHASGAACTELAAPVAQLQAGTAADIVAAMDSLQDLAGRASDSESAQLVRPASAAAAAKLFSAIALLSLDADCTLAARLQGNAPAGAAVAAAAAAVPPYLGDATACLREYVAAVASGDAQFDATLLLAVAALEACSPSASVELAGAFYRGFMTLLRAPVAPSRPAEAAVSAHALAPAPAVTRTGGWDALSAAVARWLSRPRARASGGAGSTGASSGGGSACEQWAVLKQLVAARQESQRAASEPVMNGGRPLAACERLMSSYVGLEGVKLMAVELVRNALIESSGHAGGNGGGGGARLNFLFVGNPGTGKTAVARDWAALLGELRLRPSDEGERAAREAATRAAAAAGAAAQTSEDDRLRAQLRHDVLKLPLQLAQNARAAAAATVQAVRAALAGVEEHASRFSSLHCDAAGVRARDVVVQQARAQATELQRQAAAADAQLALCTQREADAEAAKCLAEQAATVAAAAATTAAAAAAATAGGIGGFTPRFLELKGHTLASVPRAVEDMLTAVKALLAEGLRQGKGGVVLIDEAHNLDPKTTPNGRQALLQVLTLAEDHRDCLTFILTGYKQDIGDKILSADVGLASRFPHTVEFADFNAPELRAIFELKLARMAPAANGVRLSVEPAAAAALGRRLERGARCRGFGNARDVENRLAGALKRWRERVLSDLSAPTVATADNHCLTLADVMGERPSAGAGPAARVLAELRCLVGMEAVGAGFASLIAAMARLHDEDCEGAASGKPTDAGLLNRVFMGPPGTGKTTVAKLYGRLLQACGFLSSGEVVAKKPADLIGAVLGESETKTAALLEACRGKVLLIDEAYGLAQQTTFHRGAVDTLVAEIPDRGGQDLAVVLCGYTGDMERMFDTVNAGLARRFPAPHCRTEFAPYTEPQLRRIFVAYARERGLAVDFAAARVAGRQLARESTLRNFGNADAAGKLVDRARSFLADSTPATAAVTAAAPSAVASSSAARAGVPVALTAATLEALLQAERTREEEAAGTAGLSLPAELATFVAAAALGAVTERALRRPAPPPPHLILLGNPGTGKSTAARVLARELYLRGVLPTRRCVVTSAEELQAPYVGQSSGRMLEKLRDAQGGLLFIDEAHRLAPSAMGDFKSDIMGTLVAGMTGDEFRGKLCVVLAGYPDEMEAMLSRDPGLRGRFSDTVRLAAITAAEGVVMLRAQLRSGYKAGDPPIPPAADAAVGAYIEERKRLLGPAFRNRADVLLLAKRIDDAAVARLLADVLHPPRAAAAAEPAPAVAGAGAGAMPRAPAAVGAAPGAHERAPTAAATAPAAHAGAPTAATDADAVASAAALADPDVAARYAAALAGWDRRYTAADVATAIARLLQTAQHTADADARAARASGPAQRPRNAVASDAAAAAAPPAMRAATAASVAAAATSDVEAAEVPAQRLPQLSAAQQRLAPGLTARMAALRDTEGEACNFLDLLDGAAGASTQRGALLKGLREANAAGGVGASEDEMQQLLAAALAFARTELQDLTAAYTADGMLLRERARAARASGDLAAALLLDGDMRRMCTTLLTTVTVTSTRVCGYCGREDSASSGCAFRGASPAPQLHTEEHTVTTEVNTYEMA